MIICLIGTRAQTIKMAPVLLELEHRNLPYRLVLTGQHQDTIDQLFTEFGLHTAPIRLYEGREISGILQMLKWFIHCIRVGLRDAKYIFGSRKDRTVILVHGDTISTLLGAILGKWLGCDVAHVEAGLRSHNIFHPFPEELTRLAVFRLSDISFCPGAWAYENIASISSERIDTHHNTLLDALSTALSITHVLATSAPLGKPYGIASIHRFENIFNRKRLTSIIDLIETAAQHYPVIFVLHPSTHKKLTEFNLLQRIESNPRIRVTARMGYIAFTQLMKNARFVISDGGGNQEELSYLGVPTLLMRRATERIEGLGSTVTLCDYRKERLESFFEGLPAPTLPLVTTPTPSPSSMIVDRIAAYAA